MENVGLRDLNTDLYEVKLELCHANMNQHVTMMNNGMQYAMLVWTDGSQLKFFQYLSPEELGSDKVHVAQLKVTSIDFANIDYYDLEGEEHYEQVVTGGGGGGSSLGGAIIGGMLFGATGAIIASRKSIDQIKTETVHRDNRVTIMSYAENGEHKKMVFSPDSYDVFFTIIPQFDRGVIRSGGGSPAAQASASIDTAPRNSNVELLKQLKQLHDEGILTDDEYASKKREIVGRM